MRLWILILVLVLPLASRAAVVVGNIYDLTGSKSDGQITFHPTKSVVIGPNYYNSLDRAVRTTNGVFSIYLVPNDYEVRISTRPSDQHKMSVPVGNGTFNWVDLVTSPITYVYLSPGAQPATANPGQVKATQSDTSPGYLSQKLQLSQYFFFITNNVGGNESVTLWPLTVLPHTHSGADILSGTIDPIRVGAPGVDGAVLFRSAGILGADMNFVYDVASGTMSVSNIVTTKLSINGTFTPPTTSADAGVPGQFGSDGTYFYYCTGTNAWKRWLMESW